MALLNTSIVLRGILFALISDRWYGKKLALGSWAAAPTSPRTNARREKSDE